ncbi:hypothetical protein GCM10007242_41580 [Pigmentiphaga litoralis]|uniref:SGNH/GDSL hydrolase family protein n=1 Tax=Pigmentiphaga litoralis TaxID=516702 RepID=UPI00167BD12B|nr:SGNH/GDSL hydrolase family protein [Pigmentiphaga litoralis]GGX30576.1 hypothetical protein GCM10007242_41580 [Pigmentiphaga litoralis]
MAQLPFPEATARWSATESKVNEWATGAGSVNFGAGPVKSPTALIASKEAMIDSAVESRLAFTYRGVWAPGTAYARKDYVLHGDPALKYATGDAHVSGESFDADLAAGRWLPFPSETHIVTIQELGGAGDFDVATGIGRNNFFPLLNYTRLFSDGPTVHFPFITGTTNVYHFAYESIYGLGPGTVRITRDEGVKFHLVNVGFDCDVNGAIEIIPSIEMGFTYLEGNTSFGQPLNAKERHFVGAGDLIRNTFRKVNPAAEFTARRYMWPGSPNAGGSEIETLAGSGAISYTADTVEFNSPGTGYYELAEIRLKVGQRLHCSVTIPAGMAGLTPACFARTALGYYGMTWSGGNSAFIEKEAGSGYVQGNVVHPQDAYRQVHATFDPSQAIITIEPTSAYSFNILVNGALFRSRTVKDPIQAYGIGGYLAGQTAGVRYENLWIEEGGAQNSTGLLGLFYIGDSRQQDPGAPCPGRWAAKYLDGSMGMRVSQYRNQAVGGQASANQLAILLANGVPAGTTDTVIGVGTNDQQGALGAAALYANVKQMIGICKAAGSRVVLDLYPLWYTQAQAGARGQASTRYAEGNPYRATIMRLAAEERVVVVDGLTEYGLIIANMVNPALAPNLTWMDPVVADNIHGNPTLFRLQGWAHAKAILGQINKVTSNRVDWTDLPSVWAPQEGWNYVNGSARRFRANDSGDVEFRMHLTMAAGAARANGTLVHGFGKFLTPRDPVVIPVLTDLFEPGYLVLSPDGGLRCYGLAPAAGTTLRVASGVYSTY